MKFITDFTQAAAFRLGEFLCFWNFHKMPPGGDPDGYHCARCNRYIWVSYAGDP